VLLFWAVATPLVADGGGRRGSQCLRRGPAAADATASAVIVGAGVNWAPRWRARWARTRSTGRRLLGFFDDRDGERARREPQGRLLGRLRRLPPWMRQHGVREVYITLPLGSQPRIWSTCWRQLQGTTASLYFVPDVFGISIIQGRLQDINGVPVVGICETPFTGTNRLVKRAVRHRAVAA
jgi:putative colanic acid biosynthesis UDP-glucose lipid carrier transferase